MATHRRALVVALLLFLSGAAQAALFSVRCDADRHCNVTSGNVTGALAWAEYTDARGTTGWAFLQIATREHSAAEGALTRYAVGYLEGAITQELIWVHASNYFAYYQKALGHNSSVPQALTDFLNSNDAWVQQQVAQNAAADPYWAVVGDIYAQLDGIAAGYQAAAAPTRTLSRQQLLMVNLQGDMDDVLSSLHLKERVDFAKMGKEELEMYDLKRTHCSALMKLLPDGSELYAGHNMWWPMYAMNRVFRTTTIRRAGVAAPTIQQSSYPGTIASTDDFYQMPDSRLVAIETTLPNYNNSLYDLITPDALSYWVRVMVANTLASSGSQWTEMFGRHNGGTYNNMWMVVDYKLFEPHAPLPPNTLWVAEQLPGYYHAEDMTRVLSYGYWPSYNKALFPETSRLCGQDQMVELHGPDLSYQLTPRAEVFRRDQTRVVDDRSMQRVMRYNQFQTDPLAKGNPCNQLACRADLGLNEAVAALDAKFTSSQLIQRRAVQAVSGPTHDDQPVFCWSTAPSAVQAQPHEGQPDCFDFDWVVVAPTI